MEIVSVDLILKKVEKVTEGNLIDAFKLCKQMEGFCLKKKGIGLSAVQVGVGLKLFIVKLNEEFAHYANCEYSPLKEDKKTYVEGCLSIPGKFYLVDRYCEVRVKGDRLIQDGSELRLESYTEDLSDWHAVVFQHEIDHSYNKLISFIGKEVRLQG